MDQDKKFHIHEIVSVFNKDQEDKNWVLIEHLAGRRIGIFALRDYYTAAKEELRRQFSWAQGVENFSCDAVRKLSADFGEFHIVKTAPAGLEPDAPG